MNVSRHPLMWIVAAVVMSAAGDQAVGFNQRPRPVATAKPQLLRPVRVSLKNAASRTISLDGDGCTESLCSRISINTRVRGDAVLSKIMLDNISAIRDINDNDALFIFKNGDEKRLSVVPYNRVLYVINEAGKIEKLDLAKLKSVEFLNR